MTLAYYKKDPPKDLHKKKNKDRYFALASLALGLLSIGFAVWPLVSWQYKIATKYSTQVKEAPIPTGQVLSEQLIMDNYVQVQEASDGFSYFTTDFRPIGPRPKTFQLSIPKLKIVKAKVKIDSLDFLKNLSHFPGSAIPGEIGNSFITGHSVLPQFNDPKDYRAIFTKLEELEIGDEIFAYAGGKTYKYIVQYSKVVDPKDVSVLVPISKTGRNLTLMTCVPPGTSAKRLVVITTLI